MLAARGGGWYCATDQLHTIKAATERLRVGKGVAVQVEREIVFPESPAELWEALTEPERLEEWFATEAELDARPGGEGVFRWGDGEERHHRHPRLRSNAPR